MYYEVFYHGYCKNQTNAAANVKKVLSSWLLQNKLLVVEMLFEIQNPPLTPTNIHPRSLFYDKHDKACFIS